MPPEVLRLIFEDTCSHGKRTLCDIMLASRHFHNIADPVMYAVVALQDDQAGATDWLKGLLQIFETSGGRRALFVKCLIIGFSVCGQTQLQLVREILMRTKNLKGLSFPCPGAPPPFPQHPPFALKALVLYDSVLNQDSIHFFESQPSLETLYLRRSDPLDRRMSISPTALPELKHLIIEHNDLPFFLPSFARVTHLGLERQNKSLLVSDLSSASLPCVRVLSFRSSFDSPRLIALASSCANLEWLDIHDGPSRTLPFLRHLCEPVEGRKLRGIRFDNPWRFKVAIESPFQRLFDAIPSLQFVEFFNSRIGLALRWYPGLSRPKTVRWKCSLGAMWLADWEKDVEEGCGDADVNDVMLLDRP